MSHIGNKLRSGFFATPERQGEYIAQLLEVKGDGTFLDPTCGEGEVLSQIARHHQTDDLTIRTYGVELDKARAALAKGNLDYCVNAPIESMVISNKSASLLYLNPPYDYTMKGMDDEYAERKEWAELSRNSRYLKENGLMIYIIPSYRFADEKIARYLATHFYNIGVLRFSDENYEGFKQCIFIANKKSGKRKEFNRKLYDFLLQMNDEEFIKQNVTPINLMIGRMSWKVPQGTTQLEPFYTKLENKNNFYEGIVNSKGFAAFKERSKPKRLEIGGNHVLVGIIAF